MALEQTKWVGFDLDRTMAKREKGDSIKVIGEPIPRMIDLAKSYLASGVKVKIFTARVSVSNPDDVLFQTNLIKKFSKQHFGQELEVTCIKDMFCIRIYDDVARQVIANTGHVVE